MKNLVLFISATLFSLNVFSHTGYPDTVTCPICSDKVVFHLTASMTTFGSTYDFQKQGAIGYYYEEMINTCRNCYYSGYYSDFDTTFTDALVDSIRVVISPFTGMHIDESMECEIAAEIGKFHMYSNDYLANIYLTSSYFLRNDSLQIDRRKKMQNQTIFYLQEALNADEYTTETNATIQYLIGDLYRRQGDFDTAIQFYDLAINAKKKKDWVKGVAQKQKELAETQDADNSI